MYYNSGGEIMQAFEKEFSRAARWYCKRGEAIMEMLPVAKEVDARGQLRYVKLSPFDVYGIQLGSGKFLGGELKSYKSHRLGIGGTSGVKLHQMVALRDFHICGGLVFIWWKHFDEVVRLTVPEIMEIKKIDGKKSIPWELAKGIGTLIPFENGIYKVLHEI